MLSCTTKRVIKTSCWVDPISTSARRTGWTGRDTDDSNTYSVEVFANKDDLAARKKYVEAITGSMSLLCEYDTVHGLILLRVACHLTPEQAQEYADALDS